MFCAFCRAASKIKARKRARSQGLHVKSGEREEDIGFCCL